MRVQAPFLFLLSVKKIDQGQKDDKRYPHFPLLSKHKILTLVVNPKHAFIHQTNKWVVPPGKFLPGKHGCLASPHWNKPHCQVSPHWSKPHCQVSPYWVSLVLGCTCEKEARVNQHPPVHHEGWMKSDQETVFCWLPVPWLTMVVKLSYFLCY